MKKKDFENLLDGVREKKAIRQGKKRPARVFDVPSIPVKAIREKLKLSQSQFSKMIGVSVRTLQNWEQGSRQPQGSARALLTVAAKEPKAVLAALHARAG